MDYFCGYMTYDMHSTGNLWILVEGESWDDYGNFEVSVSCGEVPTPAPTAVPTPVPTSVPTPDWCSYQSVVTCNETVTDMNTQVGNYLGTLPIHPLLNVYELRIMRLDPASFLGSFGRRHRRRLQLAFHERLCHALDGNGLQQEHRL